MKSLAVVALLFFGSHEYPLSLTVTDMQQYRYAQQLGSGNIVSNCQILGNMINCTSQEIPPTSWPHVMNLMLATGSDGNTYFFGCDAAWRWSRCAALISGQTFRARLDNGLKVEVVDGKGKVREVGYSIFRIATTHSGPS